MYSTPWRVNDDYGQWNAREKRIVTWTNTHTHWHKLRTHTYRKQWYLFDDLSRWLFSPHPSIPKMPRRSNRHKIETYAQFILFFQRKDRRTVIVCKNWERGRKRKREREKEKEKKNEVKRYAPPILYISFSLVLCSRRLFSSTARARNGLGIVPIVSFSLFLSLSFATFFSFHLLSLSLISSSCVMTMKRDVVGSGGDGAISSRDVTRTTSISRASLLYKAIPLVSQWLSSAVVHNTDISHAAMSIHVYIDMQQGHPFW